MLKASGLKLATSNAVFVITEHCLLDLHVVPVALRVRPITCTRGHFYSSLLLLSLGNLRYMSADEHVRMVKPCSKSKHNRVLKLLKPSGYCMKLVLTFKTSAFCPQSTCTCTFCTYLRKKIVVFPIQHSSIGFTNRGCKCLLRGTTWVFE
jgi:hypothetical protein